MIKILIIIIITWLKIGIEHLGSSNPQQENIESP